MFFLMSMKENENENENENNLNTDWINEFEINDNIYKYFYKTNIKNVNINNIYINNNREIIYINKSRYELKSINILLKEELIEIIKKNIQINDNLFKIFSIKYFNFDLDEENISTFINLDVNNINNLNNDYNYFNGISTLENIKINNTIKMFEKLNTIYLFYVLDNPNANPNANTKPKTHSNTKKIYLNNTLNNNRKTAKIYI